MGIWDELLHPRKGGKFAAKPKKFTAGKPYGPGQGAGGRKGGGKGGKGGKGKKGRKATGPTRSELGAVGQVMAGNIVTTDGGKTWSVLGSKTPGTATRAVQRAMKDGLLSPPGRGSNHPGATKLGIADFKHAGMHTPPAKAPILAARAAAATARTQRMKQAVARKAALTAIRVQRTATKTAKTVASANRAAANPSPVRSRSSRSSVGAVRQTVSRRNRLR